MKNLFAIPRLSLSETFTILITLAVCLADFTEAEIYSDYKKEDSNSQEENNFLSKESSLKQNDQRTLEASNEKSDELKQNYFAYLKSLPESPFDKPNERYPVYFGKPDESEDEKENDGYNYDEDEYYHFNYKRNDQKIKNLENSNLQKQQLDEPERKGLLGQDYYAKNLKGAKDKELKTIEMLDFKEYHPNTGLDTSQNSMQNSIQSSIQNSIQNQKHFSKDLAHKKIPSSEPLETLNVMDLKDNSAVDESLKDRKEESSSVLASVPSDSKIAEVKKVVKTTDEKDSVKLKDPKSSDDSIKKDKEISLKDGKEVVSAKNLKDSSKTSEEKEKTVNLSESSKLEENIEKMSSNNKESDSAKITKEDKDMSRFSNKVTSDVINPKEMSQINNRANFVRNEYKESLDSIKTPESQINEKNSEEINENEKNVGLNNFSKTFKEKQYNLITEKNDKYRLLNEQYDLAKVVQDQEKSSPYSTVPLNYEFQQDEPREVFKKRESWKPASSMQGKLPQQQISMTQEPTLHRHGLLQQPQQSQMDLTYDSQQKQNPFQNTDNSLPPNELENTDYYKNYLKSLRKYKSQSDSSKNTNAEPPQPSYKLVRKIAFRDQAENRKKKRSKPKKRRLSEETSQEKEKKREQINLANLRKNSYKTQDTLPSQSEKCMVPAHDPQSSTAESEKQDTKLSEGKKCEEQLENNRLRRKSPLKLEYEIKVINQSPQDPKNVQFSRFTPMRLKKDVKTKLATGDKYLKKYPYSQVSRDDLTGLNKITESRNEKKCKRKAPTQKRYDQKSVRTRSAPSGYYGNRVKFGQKSYSRNNEKTNSDTNNPADLNKMTLSYLNSGSFSSIDKNGQSGWESKQQNLNSDEDAYLREDNSLFLVKKGERTAKAFEEGSNKLSFSSEELDPEQLAKILSKANDYVVLKKTENNKFRKISDYEPSSFIPSDFDSSPLYKKKSTFAEQLSQYNLENNDRLIPLNSKSLQTRSSNPRKDDKKYSATFRSSASKSNLKKTLNKFRDLADFFKDSEQESTDNQYSGQEAKEGRDIVFSEDKLPDPIVINNDGSETTEGLKQKPQNSIYSISTNFKNIDMPSKKIESPNSGDESKNQNMFTARVKSDNFDISWEPALRNIFPEAKTINAMNKNGNEIIVLDFNRNQLKSQHGFHTPQKMSKMQSFGKYNQNSRMPATNSLDFSGDRKVQLIVEGNPLSSKAWDKSKSENVKIQMPGQQNKNYAHVSSGEKQSTMSIPLELNELPSLLQSLIKKNVFEFNKKTVRKKSKEENPQSENYKQFLTDLDKLSEINKNSYMKKYYGEPSKERNLNNLPPSSFSELSTYSDLSIKQLGNILQNYMPQEYSVYTSNDNKIVREMPQNSKQYQNLDDLFSSTGKYGINYPKPTPNQWFSNEEKNEDKSIPKEVKDEMDDIVKNQEMSKVKEKNYEQFKEQIEKASEKGYRIRRGEMEKRNSRKTVEHDMILKESGASDMKSQEQNIKMNADQILNSNDFIKNEKDSKFQSSKKADESKENSGEEESLDSDYDSHLNEFFENLSKNPKNPNESIWNRKKRKNTHREKRFSGRDFEDKVSKTEVQNTILKNLPEDNYQSVYSPGIKRRLLSIKNEAENADADELDKNTAKETQENSVRNKANKYVDPVILELFCGDGYEEEKNRARRSLISPFHTNFKREIDLDESMPNDFQNFLVTSLGGVGSQKPEVVKKDEALWGGKESPQNNGNQIVESSSDSKEANEDSALEKREVSGNENRKTPSYSKSDYYSSRADSDSTFGDIITSFNRAEKKIRSESKSKLRSKSSEFADEKLPTQIRIQITNGSSKEKKSSKPIMDESETSSTDVENLPKEKEFFDKNKINPLLSNNLPKFHQAPKTKFSYGEFKEDENKDLGGKQKAYHSYQRKKRKRKKYIPENPMKPVKDFITFDQKAMESFLRKYKLNQNTMSDQTTQKIPVSHPLPQVETVYNPTQGTNKAQLETTRLGKMNSINNKNAESSKNSLQSNDASTYDENVIRSYLKSDKIKSNKEELKEFEDVDWKPYTRKLGLGQEAGQFEIIHPTQKIQTGNSPTFSTNVDTHPLNTYPPSANTYNQKLFQSPYSRFFYHTPSPNVVNNQLMYDVLKLKQELKNKSGLGKDRMGNKPYSKPYYYFDGLYKQDEKDKSQNPANPYLTTGYGSWNYFDHSLNKKPYGQKFRMKDYYPLMTKTTNQIEQRAKNPYLAAKKFLKNFSIDKLLNLDSQPPLMENYRDIDYLDTNDDDYLDEYPSKDSQLDELLAKEVLKKPHVSKFQEIPGYYHIYDFKTPDMEEGLNVEDDDELEEDYEENADEEDLDDYSLLKTPNLDISKLKKNDHENEELINDQSNSNIFGHLQYYNPQIRGHDTDLTKFISSIDDKFDLGVADADFKKNSDPLSKSTALLQKANENSQIFSQNVLKNLNRFRNNAEWNLPNENQGDKISLNEILSHTKNDWHSVIGNNLNTEKFNRKEKLKRSQKFPQIGSRLFYAAKTEINNDRDITPVLKIHKAKDDIKKKRSYYRTPLTDTFHAEFAGLGNDFDSESEQNKKHIGENLMILEKTNAFQRDKHSEDENEDIKENSEDEGDAIALDNYLENVMGKYIMRKTIPSSVGRRSSMKSASDDSLKHKIRKRSTQKQKFTEKEPKTLIKRLSSGHLTENNFRKYHKKNFSRKRYVKDFDSNPYEVTTLVKSEQNIKTEDRNVENEKQKKRSALDIFKKITNKDRDSKKAENSEGRTAGFEPLLTLNDKKYDNLVKDTPLMQDKKSLSEIPQAETKENLPELKAHYPNEGQHLRAQLSEKKGEKSKETLKEYPTLSAQGPWKIELNDKYESKVAERPDKEHRKSLKSSKIMEPKLLKDSDENLKAFLVISKNVKSVKRDSEDDLFPISGLFRKKIDNNYRPMSDESKEIPEKQVKKRSLTWKKSNGEDAAKTSENQFSESHVNVQEKNRALHHTKSLSEGDSKLQAPHGLQRNIKKNGSFVTANDQIKNSQFLSRERLTESVFSPTSDANINRNSRHINEETSEYLGQQIVDAILFHVNTNPKFKQLIAPGLTMRTTAFKEGTDYDKKRALHQVEFSEQLQTFFKKFMFDLEKMTEKHVNKRMCHQIDKHSKHLLQSLLITPIESAKEKEKTENSETVHPSNEPSLGAKSDKNPDPLSFMATAFDRPETVNFNQMRENSLKPEKHVLDDLQVKQDLLQKLVNNYQNLSNVEKEALNNNHRSLQELDQTSHLLATPKNQLYLIPTASFQAKNSFQNGTSYKTDLDGIMKLDKKMKQSNDQSVIPLDTTTPSYISYVASQNQPHAVFSKSSSDSSNTGTPDDIQLKSFPVYYFTEVQNPKEHIASQTTPPYNPFEMVYPVNQTNSSDNEIIDQRKTTQQYNPTKYKDSQLAVPTPQTFDLLSYDSSTTESTVARNNDFLDPKISENLGEKKTDNVNFEEYLYKPYGRPTELHKLSLGDAAGLQLSLKHQSPWVSNLDVAKSLRSVPKVSQPEASIKVNQPLQKNIDQFSDESRDTRSLITPGKEYPAGSRSSNDWNDEANYFYTKPIFSTRVDKKFYIPKVRPFENANHCKWPTKNSQSCPFEYFLRKGSPPNNKISSKNTQGKPLQEENFFRKYFEKKRKRQISHFLIHHPKGGAKKLKKF